MSSSARYHEKAWLFTLICLSIALRIAIFGQRAFPPGDDSAMQTGFTQVILSYGRIPSFNPYHMPGTPYTYPPLFQLLTAGIVLIDGLPAMLTVFVLGLGLNIITTLPIYSLAKRLSRNTFVGLAAAFLMAFNFPDLYMLSWGGSTTVFTLFIISLLFLLLQKPGNPIADTLAMCMLTGALFLSHQLSSFIYVSIAVTCLILCSATKGLSSPTRPVLARKLIVSLVMGLGIAAFWLTSKLAYYIEIFRSTEILQEEILMALSKLTIGLPEFISIIGVALTLSLFILIGLYAIGRGTGWTSPRFLMIVVWMIVPLILATTFMYGIAVYYQRYLYFVNYPFVIAISTGLVYLASKTCKSPNRNRRSIVLLIVGMLLFTNAASTTILVNMSYNWYLTVNEQDFSTISWIDRYSTYGAVVTNHSLGWWMAGISHKQVLASSALAYLTYTYEVDLAKTADFILTANYEVENGFVKIRETGPYFSEFNPLLYLVRKGIAYRTVYFSDKDTHILFQKGGVLGKASLDDKSAFPIRTVAWSERSNDLTIIRSVYAGPNIQVTKDIALRRGTYYTNFSYHLNVLNGNYTILGLITTAHFDQVDKPVVESTWIGTLDLKLKAGINIIGKQEITLMSITGNSAQFVIPGSDSEIDIVLFDVDRLTTSQAVGEILRYSNSSFATRPNPVLTRTPVTSIDSIEAVRNYNVQYIVCTRTSAEKLLYDPRFELVYANGQDYVFNFKK